MDSKQAVQQQKDNIMTFNINNNTFVIALAVALVTLKYGVIALVF